jgi:hypothetical protein
MTGQDFMRLHRVYAEARNGKLGDALWCAANAADMADEAIRARLAVNWKGLCAEPLRMPNDDRAERVVLTAFAAVLAFNNYVWQDLAEVIEATAD